MCSCTHAALLCRKVFAVCCAQSPSDALLLLAICCSRNPPAVQTLTSFCVKRSGTELCRTIALRWRLLSLVCPGCGWANFRFAFLMMGTMSICMLHCFDVSTTCRWCRFINSLLKCTMTLSSRCTKKEVMNLTIYLLQNKTSSTLYLCHVLCLTLKLGPLCTLSFPPQVMLYSHQGPHHSRRIRDQLGKRKEGCDASPSASKAPHLDWSDRNHWSGLFQGLFFFQYSSWERELPLFLASHPFARPKAIHLMSL